MMKEDKTNNTTPTQQLDLDKWAHEVVEVERKRERMYHYTFLDTSMAILSGVEGDAFILHAGSIYTMNDSDEMKLGYDYVEKCLYLVDEELNVPMLTKCLTCEHEELLASIPHFPEIARDYDKLTEEFKKFCKISMRQMQCV